MTIGAALKAYRMEHSMSMQDVADKIGCSRAYISTLEKGVNPVSGKPVVPGIEIVGKIADMIGIESLRDLANWDSLDELAYSQETAVARDNTSGSMESGSVNPGIRFIPLLGSVAAGRPIFSDNSVEGIIPVVSGDLDGSSEYFALTVHGESMTPKLYNGDIVIVKQCCDVGPRDFAVVSVGNEEATVKMVHMYDDGMQLIALNTDVYQPTFYSAEKVEKLPIRILGKVVMMQRTF